jgi:carboxyl-terminal processing protease
MAIKDGILTVVAPLENSPAQRSGIRAGDKVLKINGETTENLGLSEAVSRIRGPRGSEVTLSVFHPDEEELREIVIRRDSITVKSVIFEMRDTGIASIQITRFGEDTTSEFKKAAADATRQGATAILLDVRNNPGGFLEGAIDLAGYFLSPGSVVVIEENAAKKRREFRSSGSGVFSRLPVAILMNEGSASASEILAAALRENRDDVRLIGERSFGKGSVQELIPVSSDTSVKVTVARWLTPRGNQINSVGINADDIVKLTRDDIEADRDPQEEAALNWLRQ